MKDLKYLSAYLLPLVAVFGLFQGGVYAYSAVVFIFVVIPIVEVLAPYSTANYNEEERAKKLANRFFDWLLYLNVPIVYGTIGVFIYVLNTYSLSNSELVGHILGVGLVLGSCGINVGHELGIATQNQSSFLPNFYCYRLIIHTFLLNTIEDIINMWLLMKTLLVLEKMKCCTFSGCVPPLKVM